MNAEQRAIASLRTNAGQLRSELINLLPQLFTELRAIKDRIVKLSPILGLMTRGYQLMICCTEQLVNRNFNGFYKSFRGLVELLSPSAAKEGSLKVENQVIVSHAGTSPPTKWMSLFANAGRVTGSPSSLKSSGPPSRNSTSALPSTFLASDE